MDIKGNAIQLYVEKRIIDQCKGKWVLSRTNGKGMAALSCLESKEVRWVGGRISRLSACKFRLPGWMQYNERHRLYAHNRVDEAIIKADLF